MARHQAPLWMWFIQKFLNNCSTIKTVPHGNIYNILSFLRLYNLYFFFIRNVWIKLYIDQICHILKKNCHILSTNYFESLSNYTRKCHKFAIYLLYFGRMNVVVEGVQPERFWEMDVIDGHVNGRNVLVILTLHYLINNLILLRWVISWISFFFRFTLQHIPMRIVRLLQNQQNNILMLMVLDNSDIYVNCNIKTSPRNRNEKYISAEWFAFVNNANLQACSKLRFTLLDPPEVFNVVVIYPHV